MNEEKFLSEVEDLIKRIDGAETDNFVELLEIADVNFKKELAQQNLSNFQLAKADLSRGNFVGVDFTGADLSEADLNQGDFSEAIFAGANLAGANLSQGNFSKADFTDAALNNADLSQGNFANADLTRANVSESNLRQGNFLEANLAEANLYGTRQEGAIFSDEILELNEQTYTEDAAFNRRENDYEYVLVSNRLTSLVQKRIERGSEIATNESVLERGLGLDSDRKVRRSGLVAVSERPSNAKVPLNTCWSQSIATPKLVQVESNLFVSAFSVMKVLPAIHIIQQAIERREINPQSTIVETSSGTFALGLAIVCNELKLPLLIVSDPAIDQRLKNRLESLNARVQIAEKPALGGGYYKSRLDIVRAFLKANPEAYWTRQYDNTDNPDSYQSFAGYLLQTFGNDFTLVGTVGSGGSTVGTIRHLRKRNPNIQLVGVDTFNSVLFGLQDGPRLLQGLGNSIMPRTLVHACYDEVHWVAAEQAFLATHNLHNQHAVFGGPTSGAAYMVALHIAKQNPDRTVVFIGADDGDRYLSTIFSHQWLADQGIVLNRVVPCPQPTVVDFLSQVSGETSSWTSFAWQRRSLPQVLASEQSDLSTSDVSCPR